MGLLALLGAAIAALGFLIGDPSMPWLGLGMLGLCSLGLYSGYAGDREMRTMRVNISGSDRDDAIDHEVAHCGAGYNLGGTVTGGWVDDYGNGQVSVRMPRSAPPEDHAAVYLAGAFGEGADPWSAPQARSDRLGAIHYLQQVPDAQRPQARRDAVRKGRRHRTYRTASIRSQLKRNGKF